MHNLLDSPNCGMKFLSKGLYLYQNNSKTTKLDARRSVMEFNSGSQGLLLDSTIIKIMQEFQVLPTLRKML